MAALSNSTPMPAPQRGLLRALAGSLTLPKSGDTPTPTGAVPPHDTLDTIEALLEPPEAAEARGLHSRRRLTEALEHGFALLDALDLPPLALDVIDDTIAHLDALDAPGEDLEDDGLAEEEPDDEDDDPTEETSLETAGRGLVRCGADDAEDDDPAERGEENGSEDETYPWRFQPDAWAVVAEVHHG